MITLTITLLISTILSIWWLKTSQDSLDDTITEFYFKINPDLLGLAANWGILEIKTRIKEYVDKGKEVPSYLYKRY